ncbi:hypothetical protein Cabys_2241 [Caldithrix abyssi DSM 13497]|uniref:Uncharacterized protein n=1 Tax=Caldithrix abyssi DSM 13497 TaxID=880073 RepID=A0A1J1C8X0_CALAY|nr:hypothetical protein Cabys_2241 [Caldithrix abyssi DSM 13497]
MSKNLTTSTKQNIFFLHPWKGPRNGIEVYILQKDKNQ